MPRSWSTAISVFQQKLIVLSAVKPAKRLIHRIIVTQRRRSWRLTLRHTVVSQLAWKPQKTRGLFRALWGLDSLHRGKRETNRFPPLYTRSISHTHCLSVLNNVLAPKRVVLTVSKETHAVGAAVTRPQGSGRFKECQPIGRQIVVTLKYDWMKLPHWQP